MALQGTLKDFSVADIFQLIGQQGKSGSLFVVAGDQETHVVFDKGSVVLARFIKSHEDLRLGNMLLRAGIITKNQLETAFEEHRRVMKSLGDVLLGNNFISQETLSEFLNLQTREVLFRIIQWKSGIYRFKTEEFHYNKQIIHPISTDYLLMDGFRQLDEWPAIIEELGSLEAVFDLTAKGRETVAFLMQQEASGSKTGFEDEMDAAFVEFAEESADTTANKNSSSTALQESEKSVLKLIDGQHPVAWIIDHSRLGQFETCKSLLSLKKGKLVQEVTDFQPSAVQSSYRDSLAPRFSLKDLILHGIFYLALLTTVAALIFHMRPDIMGAHAKTTLPGVATVIPQEFVKDYRVRIFFRRLRTALELYRVENTSYPNNIESLVKEGLLSHRDWKKITREQFHYLKSLETISVFASPY